MTIETLISIYAATFLFAALFCTIASFISRNVKLFTKALYCGIEGIALTCMQLAIIKASTILSILSISMMIVGIVMIIWDVAHEILNKSKSEVQK